MSTRQETTASMERRVQFSLEDEDTDSDSHDVVVAADSSKVNQNEPEYYDPIYFDSDEEDDDDDDDDDAYEDDDNDNYNGGVSSSRGTRTDHDVKMKGITRGLQASTLEPSSTSTSTSISSPSPSSSSSSGIKTSKKKTKQRPTISDADLLYDPDEDDRDQDWLIQKIAANRPPGCKPEDIWTDAILSCPMCMTHLCFDCQQHEFYPHQFRAMFVESCRVLDSEILRFAKETKPSGRNNRRTTTTRASPSPSPSAPSVSTSASTSTSPSTSSSSSTTTTTTTIPQPETSEGTSSALHFKPSEDDDTDAIYHPVICEICNTKVAVVDQDEVYHFFNVIPTPV